VWAACACVSGYDSRPARRESFPRAFSNFPTSRSYLCEAVRPHSEAGPRTSTPEERISRAAIGSGHPPPPLWALFEGVSCQSPCDGAAPSTSPLQSRCAVSFPSSRSSHSASSAGARGRMMYSKRSGASRGAVAATSDGGNGGGLQQRRRQENLSAKMPLIVTPETGVRHHAQQNHARRLQ